MDRSTTIAEEKRRLRQWAREILAQQSPWQLAESDRALFSSFLALPQVKRAETVFLFWGIPGREPDTKVLVETLSQQGKRVGLPRMMPGRELEVRLYQPQRPMVTARFGIQEPPADAPLLRPEEIDLTLVPAVCYDRQGYRLGFGGGYYDQWLPRFSGVTVGLCRQCLLRRSVPREPHDQRVQLLLTERELLSLHGWV